MRGAENRAGGAAPLASRVLPFAVPGCNNALGFERGAEEAQCRLRLSAQPRGLCFIWALWLLVRLGIIIIIIILI